MTKNFYWYLVRTFKSFRKAYWVMHYFNVAYEMFDYPTVNKVFRAFYTFVETHKGVLKVEDLGFVNMLLIAVNPNWHNRLWILAYDKVLKVRRRYWIELNTEKLEEVELI